MTKTLVVVLLVSVIVAAALCGCRPINTVPGVTAAISAIPTLPIASPSPLATTGAVSTLPLTSATAGVASVAPSATP